MSARTVYLLIGIFLIPVCLLGFFYLTNIGDSSSGKTSSQTQLQVKRFELNNEKKEPLDVLANTLPQFAMKLVNKNFTNIWKAKAAQRDEYVQSTVIRAKGDVQLETDATFDEGKKEVIVTPKLTSGIKPGLYKLNITVKTTQGVETTITQDFTWGVLAINTQKDVYTKGETVKIGMAVLDDLGQTKCMKEEHMFLNSAKVWLTVTSPKGVSQEFSTEAHTIAGSSDCKDRNFTNKPDFFTEMMAVESGTYKLHMESETVRGKKSIDDVFFVQSETPLYEIERTAYPIRIYPRYKYPVVLSVTVHKDYMGRVYDIVPASFEISEISDGGKVEKEGEIQKIYWDISWKNGENHSLSYAIKFPPVTPEFYLVGPFTIGAYIEQRSWQIASDSIFAIVQEAHNTAASGTSVAATFSAGATLNHLIVLICSRDVNSAWTTPTGYTRRYRVQAAPRLYHFDRLATAGLTVATCSTTVNSGEIAAQALEFSGNSTSGYFDKVATATHNNTTCNSGGFTETTNPLTPTNPDELLVSGFASTNGNLTSVGSPLHTVISGASSTGFTSTDLTGGSDGYSGGAASYESAYGEAVNNPAVSSTDRVVWSAAAGTCSSDIAAYNASITLSQGSYRFFDNADSLTPGSPLAATNTAITLNQPNYPFRLRMLIDADSPSGTTLALQAADLILQYATLPSDGNCANGDWNPVATTSAIAYNVNPSQSGKLLPNIATTVNDPSDGGYSTIVENYVELYLDDNPDADVQNNQNTIGNNQAAMWDFSLVDATDDSVSQTYCLALFNSSGSNLNAYLNYPKVTTIINDVVIRGGTTITGGTTIR